MKKIYTAIALITALNASSQPITLATSPPLTGGTSTSTNSGITMNLHAYNDVNILAFRAQVGTSGTGYEIWYKTDSISGPPNITTANNWVMHETGSTSVGNPQTINLANPLPIPGGSTYGVCFRLLGSSVYYTSSPSPSSFKDANLRIEVGNLAGYAGTLPTPTLHPRGFTGAIIYELSATSPNDIGIASIDSPAGGCEGDYNVVVTVKNFGINQVDTATVNWMHNGSLQTPVTIYNVLDTNGGLGSTTAQVTLGNITLVGGFADTIIAWTTDPNNVTDTVNDNDTAIKVMNPLSLLTTFPHYQDFESGPGEWYTSGSLSSWVLGKPNKTVIKGAASDSNAWVTGGLGTLTHNTSENSQVNSPCFDLSDFKGTPWVAIDVWWNAEFSFDGAVLQSSLDGGKTWQKVGKHLDPNNWYNDNTIVGNPGGQQEGWSGRNSTNNGSTKYLRAKHVLDPSLLIKGVRFRVAFGADASVNDEGFAFDNFILVDMQKPDMGQDTVSLCGNPSLTLDPNIVSNGEFKWFDGDSISTTKVVNAPGIYWVQYTDSMINETKRDTIEVVQSVAPQIAFASTVDTISIDDQITLDPNLPYDLDFTWMPGGYNFPFLLVKASDFGLGSHLFNLHVMDSVLCEDSENVTVVILDYTGIDNRDDGMVEVYPNPVNSTLVLDLRNAGAGSHAVSISDLQGRILYNNAWELNSGGRIVLDFSGFAPGNYIIRITSSDGVITRQVVKN